jgi:hypothetical protein
MALWINPDLIWMIVLRLGYIRAARHEILSVRLAYVNEQQDDRPWIRASAHHYRTHTYRCKNNLALELVFLPIPHRWYYQASAQAADCVQLNRVPCSMRAKN